MRTVAVLFALAGAVVANPVLVTYLSEFGVDSAGRAWVEFNAQPEEYGDFHGALLTTSCSECTLNFDIQPGEYVVVDSEALAQRVLGWGKLRFNPLADSLFLSVMQGMPAESVRFPVVPTGQRAAPAPPPGGSVACCNNSGLTNAVNWYVDSTPTRGGPNDDFSSIGGRVDWDSTLQAEILRVWARGCYGTMAEYLDRPGEYVVPGLGPGTYEVGLRGLVGGQWLEMIYPESVRVSYSQTVGGINFRIPSSAVAEQSDRQAVAEPWATLVRGSLLLPASSGARARSAVLFDASGSTVLTLHPGRNDVSGLSPGVYFVREGPQAASLKLQAVRKVVVTR